MSEQTNPEQTNPEQGVPQQGSSGDVSEAQDHGFGVDEDDHGWAPDAEDSGVQGAGHQAWEAQDTQDAATDRGDSSSS